MKKLLLSALIIVPNLAHGNQCIAVFEGNDPDKIFVREYTENLDPIYRENMKNVMREFSTMLEPNNLIAELTYEEFLQQMKALHKSAILGAHANSVYWPGVGQRNNGMVVPVSITEAKSNVARFRYEAPGHSVNRPLVQVVPIEKRTLDIIKMKSKSQEIVLSKGPVSLPYLRPRLRGVATDALPRYAFRGADIIEYQYPAAMYQKVYFTEMKKSFDLIRHSVAKNDKQKTLHELAHYYQLAMIAHPFSRVNNSIFMIEVNVVLQKLGMAPVYQGRLDYLVRSLDSDDAEKEFMDYLSHE